MKMKSVSGLALYVKDLARGGAFYEKLGLTFHQRDDWHAPGYSNWFWIELIAAKKEQRAAYQEGRPLLTGSAARSSS